MNSDIEMNIEKENIILYLYFQTYHKGRLYYFIVNILSDKRGLLNNYRKFITMNYDENFNKSRRIKVIINNIMENKIKGNGFYPKRYIINEDDKKYYQ